MESGLMWADESAEVVATRVEDEPRVSDFDAEAWTRARPVPITRYWSGEAAPAGRHAEARLLWGAGGLAARFVCAQDEPLVVSAEPQTDRKTLGLWDRDVCEIFVAPDVAAPHRYFEFEAAPTGEWIDLAVEWSPAGRRTDWDYRSGMEAAARVESGRVTITMRVPWSAFGVTPRAGDCWRANLYRCVGADPTRGYLTWRPTLMPEPNFHAPDAFGRLRFG
jgi:hypothetical protein